MNRHSFTETLDRDFDRLAHDCDSLRTHLDGLRHGEDSCWDTASTLDTLLSLSPWPIAVLGTDASVRLWSPAAKRLFGWSEEELMEKEVPFVPDGRLEEVRKLFQALLRGQWLFGLETTRLRKDGSPLQVNISAAPVPGSHGSITRMLFLFEEIAKHVAREKSFKAADQRKEEFMATLGHELRNALAPILAGVQLLCTPGTAESDRAQACRVIERRVCHMASILDDLLDLSRICQGKMELRFETVGLVQAMTDALEAVRPILEARDQELILSMPDERLFLRADRSRLEQILTNLLSNASKYTDLGGRIWFSGERAGGEAILKVSDSGVGIAPEALQYIFDLYFQVERPQSGRGGMGIGLALVKRLTELHGGTVKAHSEGLNRGSEFQVWLPLTESGLEARPKKEGSDFEGRPLKVLVAEDDPDQSRFLAILIRSRGHECRTAGNAVESIKEVESFKPDVVLLDLGLPDLDGYEVARRIRMLPGAERTFLVAVSGRGGEEDQRRSREAGLDRHLLKPVGMEVLESVLVEAREPQSGRPIQD